jgi:hypothetical protein
VLIRYQVDLTSVPDQVYLSGDSEWLALFIEAIQQGLATFWAKYSQYTTVARGWYPDF